MLSDVQVDEQNALACSDLLIQYAHIQKLTLILA